MPGVAIFRRFLIPSQLPLLCYSILFALLYPASLNAQGVDPASYYAPATSTTGTYFVQWYSPGSLINVYESKQGVTGETLISGVPADRGSLTLTRSNGVYTYKFWRCNSAGTGCTLWGTKVTTVTVAAASSSSASSVSVPPVGVTPAPAPTSSGSSTPVGTLTGAFKVGESGAATYNIPIAVPAGVAGVAPKLAVIYDSQSGNGVVGMGASISGLGSITRCRQTLLQDGAVLPISWNVNDRFCLNGQRLMLFSGTYGSAESTYKTEIDSYVLVTAKGGSAGNPGYFEVEAKDGSKSTYGGTTDSRLSGANTMNWSISRFEDNMGNRIDYIYEGDRTSGQRIKTINYAYPAAKSSTSPAASISFVYEGRVDVASGYMTGGYLFKNTQRLDTITTKNGTAVYRKYYFNYNETGPNTDEYLSRLTSAQECMTDGLTMCYPKTSFVWGKTVVDDSGTIWLSNNIPVGHQYNNHLFMDYNGDGRKDLVWIERSGTRRYIGYAGTTASSPNEMIRQKFSGTSDFIAYDMIDDHQDAEPVVEVLDYNADGRQDLVVCLPTGRNTDTCASWDLYLSTPDFEGKWHLSNIKKTLPFTSKNIRFGDVDSDGLLDAVEFGSTIKIYPLKRREGVAPTSNTYYEFAATPTNGALNGSPAFTPSATQAETYGYKYGFLGDVNGDGRLDIFIPVKKHYTPTSCQPTLCDPQRLELYTYINTGTQFTYSSGYSPLLLEIATTGSDIFSVAKVLPHDFNNDGMVDVIFSNQLNWLYRLNVGSGFGSAITVTSINSPQETIAGIDTIDLNGDGYSDVIWHDKKNTKLKWRAWDAVAGQISTTDNELLSSAPVSKAYNYIDINGDGIGDRVENTYVSERTIKISIYRSSSVRGRRITEITNGNLQTTTITYEPLSNSDHYTTLKGVNTATNVDPSNCHSWSPCVPQYVQVMDDFYVALNRPFGQAFEAANPAPVLELAGPIYIVAEVNNDVPIASNPNNTNSASYHYHHARLQAGGRGYLGFEKLTIIDHQTGVRTETTYRQDWPYTGSPSSTVVKTKDGHKLSEATNTMAAETDALNSRIRRVYLDISTEVSYALKNNGALQGSSLQTVTTNTDYDDSGNITRIQSTTSGNANTSVKTVINTFSTDDWAKRMGRILTTTTTTQRNSDTAITRNSSFEYYGRNETWPGMLKFETIEPGSDNSLVIEYRYDAVGNKTETLKTAYVKPGVSQTRKTVVEYDTSKRYAKTSKDSFENVTSGVVSYHSVYGLPTQVRDANGVTTTIKYNSQGQEYQRINATGAWTHTNRDYCGTLVSCPGLAVYRVENLVSGGGKSTEYLDALGRNVRTTTVLFDGRESHVDTEYDALGRVERQSTPYMNGETQYWTIFEYDILGRVTAVTAPDGTITTTTYDGYKTTVNVDINGKALQRVEERNSIGHLVKVTDELGGTITYGYDALGNLTSATTVASGKTVRVQMCYDYLGRKVAMHDPDKGGFLGGASTSCATVATYLSQPAANKLAGWWFYQYNDFGELIEQTDTKKQTTVMDYDAVGRMIKRTDKFANGSVDTHTRWYYDKYLGETVAKPETQLNLTAVVTSYGSINENCSGSNYCQTYLFDTASRVTDTFTYLPNHNVGYINSVKYDSIGRVYETGDVLNGLVGTSGTKTLFNAYGYAGEIRDLASNDILQKTIKVNGRGQVTEEWRNNGGAGIATYQYDDKTGAMKTQKASIAGGVFPIQDITYDWDTVGNLKSRWNQSSNIGRTAKKNLQESFCYDGLNRLIKSHVGTLTGSCSLTAANQDVEYDGLGNIMRKNGVGTYSYTGKGPHAVTSTINDGTYTYDNNGNQVSGASRSITYSSYDQPTRITKGTTITEFSYGPDRARWQRIETKGSQVTSTQYLGNVERIDVQGSNIVEWKRYIAGAIYTVRTTAVVSGGSLNYSVQRSDKSYVYNDHLGSLDVVVNHAGTITHTASFDAWGNRRNAENWTGAFSATSLALTNYTNPITLRGYTGHEMLDDTGLIHMNGRIFDPRLARFMQADPFIQAAVNTQSYNRYSYTLNNPLNATDPSGYFWAELFVAAVVSYGVGDYAQRNGIPFLAQIASVAGCITQNPVICGGAAFGATYGATKNLGLAVLAGVSAGVLSGTNPVDGFFAGGILGMVSATMEGQDPLYGFMGGATGGAMSRMLKPGIGAMLTTIVVGGSISEMTGGKFANGAATAAFSYAASWAAQKYGPGGKAHSSSDGEVLVNEEGTPEDRQKTFAEVRNSNEYKDHDDIKFVDKYMGVEKQAGQKDKSVPLSTKEEYVEWAKTKVDGVSKGIINGTYDPNTGQITLYRSAVIPFKGHLYTTVGTYSGYRTGLERAYITMGHEVAHRYGLDMGVGNAVPHAEGNFYGILNCQSAGHCAGF